MQRACHISAFLHMQNSRSDESCISCPWKSQLTVCVLGNAGFGLVRSIVSMIYDSILCPYPVLGSNIWFEIKKIIILKGDGGEGLEIPEFRFSGISIILYKQNSKIMTLLLCLFVFFSLLKAIWIVFQVHYWNSLLVTLKWKILFQELQFLK